MCTLGLLVACFFSIYNDIAFDEEKAAREQQVIARLMQIRDAEEQYKMTYGEYCGTIDSVIDFVKNGKTVDKIIKEGELTDDQLEAGMTEREAEAKEISKQVQKAAQDDPVEDAPANGGLFANIKGGDELLKKLKGEE